MIIHRVRFPAHYQDVKKSDSVLFLFSAVFIVSKR